MRRRSRTRRPASMRDTSRKLDTRAWIFSPLSRICPRMSGGMSAGRDSPSVRSSVYPRMTVSGPLMSCMIIERKSARSWSSACCSLQSRNTPTSAFPSVSRLRVTSHTPHGDSTPALPSSPRQEPCSAAASTVSSGVALPGSRTKSPAGRPTMAETGAPHASARARLTKRMRPLRSMIATPSAVARSASAKTSASSAPSTRAASPIVGSHRARRMPPLMGTAASMGAHGRRLSHATLRYRIDASRTWAGFSLESIWPMGARGCAQCGTVPRTGAKFCAECGESLGGVPARERPWRLTAAGAAVLGVFLSAGLAIWTFILVPAQGRAPGGPRAASAPPAPGSQQLPEGHPTVPLALPAEVKSFIADLAAKAKEKPQDADAWARLGQVEYREAHKEAIPLFERYLALRPDDPTARTDLGTMYLYAGDVGRAVATYKAVIQRNPSFVQAHYNLAVTYHQQGDDTGALAELRTARNVAGEDAVRNQIDEMIARLTGDKATTASSPFQSAVERAFRSHPIVGPKIVRFDWSGPAAGRVLVENFPMEAMPPAVREKFTTHMGEELRSAQSANHVDGPVRVEIADASSGTVMATVTP